MRMKHRNTLRYPCEFHSVCTRWMFCGWRKKKWKIMNGFHLYKIDYFWSIANIARVGDLKSSTTTKTDNGQLKMHWLQFRFSLSKTRNRMWKIDIVWKQTSRAAEKKGATEKCMKFIHRFCTIARYFVYQKGDRFFSLSLSSVCVL